MFDHRTLRNSLILIGISIWIAWIWALPTADVRLYGFVNQLGWMGLLFFLIGGMIFIAIRGVFDLLIFAWKALFTPSTVKKLDPYVPRQKMTALAEEEEKEASFDHQASSAHERYKQNERLAITLMLAGAIDYILSLMIALIFIK